MIAKHAKIKVSKSFARFASFADPCCSGAEYPALYRKQRAPREAGLWRNRGRADQPETTLT